MGKRTAQKDTIINTTSDSQVNSNFPYRWSPASLTFNNYFCLFLCLYITRITINNNTPHLKITKEPKQKSHLGTASIETTRVGGWGAGAVLDPVCGRPTLALDSALAHQTKQLRTTKTNRIKNTNKKHYWDQYHLFK